MGKSIAPFFYIGGNHDLTNLALRDVWQDRYGPRYYHFVYKDVLFMVFDTEDYPVEKLEQINRLRNEFLIAWDAEAEDLWEMDYATLPERKTGEISSAQSAYFEQVLSENAGVRWTFLFLHKPVWLRDDKLGLGRVETALSGRPYTVFNGQEHRYSYRQNHNRDYIMLGTTGGFHAQDGSAGAFDHVTLVTVSEQEPSIVNIMVDGVLDKTGEWK